MSTAPRDSLLAALRQAGDFGWVHNAAITNDIEALRAICLRYSKWWNTVACPLIEEAESADQLTAAGATS